MATRQYPTLRLAPKDAAILGNYQRAKFDPHTGLAWIEDGTAGVAHSAHPNVEANKYSRRKYFDWIECRGFLYSPDIFRSTELDKLAARYCQCPSCQRSREARAEVL